MKNNIAKVLILIILSLLPLVKGTNSFFSDSTVVVDNIFSTGTWITPVPTTIPTITLTPTPIPTAGSVVINEVMWMGSTVSSADEWIELRNTTNKNIDLSNWRIDGAVTGSGGHLEIPASGTHIIPAYGYFLIANYPNDDSHSSLNVKPNYDTTSLNLDNDYDDNGQVVLKDKDQNVIDSAPIPTSSSWPAGVNGTNKQSMERNTDPSSGWHTCTDVGCTSTAFWDMSGNNYGTPGSANLSDEGNLTNE
jgi:hypothetical protein